MNIAGWMVVTSYAVAFGCLVRYGWTRRRDIVDAAKELSLGGWALVLFGGPVVLLLVLFVLIVPLALVNGWLTDSRPDGCYRQVTIWNPATKTSQTKYNPVPCPEQVVP